MAMTEKGHGNGVTVSSLRATVSLDPKISMPKSWNGHPR